MWCWLRYTRCKMPLPILTSCVCLFWYVRSLRYLIKNMACRIVEFAALSIFWWGIQGPLLNQRDWLPFLSCASQYILFLYMEPTRGTTQSCTIWGLSRMYLMGWLKSSCWVGPQAQLPWELECAGMCWHPACLTPASPTLWSSLACTVDGQTWSGQAPKTSPRPVPRSSPHANRCCGSSQLLPVQWVLLPSPDVPCESLPELPPDPSLMYTGRCCSLAWPSLPLD